ncbi:MAG: hypothetical protein AAFX99_22040, partial [Myxococcota bacterium]
MRNPHSFAMPLVLLVTALAACSSGGGNSTSDGQDTSLEDTGADDDTGADTNTEDTGTDDDTSSGDTDNADTGPMFAMEFTAVDVPADAPATTQLAIQACQGLYNRDLGGSVYTLRDDKDRQWLTELDLEPAEIVEATDFLTSCVADMGACVRYDYDAQQILLPNILTVASELRAIPLDVEMAIACEEPVFDATVEFAERNTPELATRYVYENYLDGTTGLGMHNPGYDQSSTNYADPPIITDMTPALVDYMFSRRLFLVFLINGCEAGHPEQVLFSEIVNNANWTRPIGVYGYNNSWNIGGYLHEAQTLCLDSRDMGAIPTETTNLSFFSTRRPPITEEGVLESNPLEEVSYDPNTTFVAFVVGDGDNVRFIMATRNVWLGQRLDWCADATNPCPPVTWSISPHLPQLAPDVIEWYYARARETGSDYFLLPPSGHQYAYPTSMNDQAG